MRRVNVIGVGMTKFTSPKALRPYTEMGKEALRDAFKDAGVDYKEIQHAYVGWVYADSCAGQKVLYETGMTGIPIFNVNNNCSTGSSALFLARQAVASGLVECALALGFEQMTPGALGMVFSDRPVPMQTFFEKLFEVIPSVEGVAMASMLFGGAGVEHQKKYGTKNETFAKKHNISKPVYIAAQSMYTDFASSFESRSPMSIVGYDMTAAAAKEVYENSGIGPNEVDVVELHDCFTCNELITYEGLGLTPEGTAEKFIEDGDNTYGGRVVTNPSGGLLSKGHPLGATGLAQCAELVWQLRGQAGVRQVEGARIALQQNIGLGGAVVVTMYRKD